MSWAQLPDLIDITLKRISPPVFAVEMFVFTSTLSRAVLVFKPCGFNIVKRY